MGDPKSITSRPAPEHARGSAGDTHILEAPETGGANDSDGERESPSFDAVLHALASAPSVRELDLDLEGMTLDRRYRVERRLGQGGMGVVYEALDTRLGRKVALKVLRASERGSKTTHERLLEEARRLARLSHPNIATVYDAGEHEGIVFLALERAGGRSLRARLAEPVPLTMTRTIAILRAIAAALACAHEAGIVHRDLKPENVVVGDGGDVKIIDFGLATLAGSGAGPAGTRRYMAPEQIAGAHASAQADVFAFGVLARELLSATATAMRERGTRIALQRLVVACCADAPEARPRDGAALVVKLETIAASIPAMSRAAVAVAIAAAAATITAAATSRPGSTPPEEPIAVPAPAVERSSAPVATIKPWSSPQPAESTSRAAPSPNRAPEQDEGGIDNQRETQEDTRRDVVDLAGDQAPKTLATGTGLFAPLSVETVRDGGLGLPWPSPLRPSFTPIPACKPGPGAPPSIPRFDLPKQKLQPRQDRGMPLSSPPPNAPKIDAPPDGGDGALIELAARAPQADDSSSGDDKGGSSPSVGSGAPGQPANPSSQPVKGAVSIDTKFDESPNHRDPSSIHPNERPEDLQNPVRFFLYADFPPDSIRLVAHEDGTLELVADMGEEEPYLVAIFDIDGTLIEIGDGVSLWQASFALDG